MQTFKLEIFAHLDPDFIHFLQIIIWISLHNTGSVKSCIKIKNHEFGKIHGFLCINYSGALTG